MSSEIVGDKKTLKLATGWNEKEREIQILPQPTGTDVLLLTSTTGVGSLVGVESFVKLQMNKLGEFRRAQITGVGFLPRVESQMRLQVRSAAEPLLADVALVRLLPGVHQMVLLQMGQLREALGADVAFERPLARVSPQVHLNTRNRRLSLQ